MDNICRFIPTRQTETELQIIHFVLECSCPVSDRPVLSPMWGVYLVRQGKGQLCTPCGDWMLETGTLFFTFPAKPYRIENLEGLEYYYITFLGSRAPALSERTGVSPAFPVCSTDFKLLSLWEDALQQARGETADLTAEGLLLYTLATLCRSSGEIDTRPQKNAILEIKAYVDGHYFEPGLTLREICELFSYSAKYVSAGFRRLTKISFREYVQNKRLEHAEGLMRSGFDTVREISFFSGYSDPLYFSKVFRKRYGMSPTDYLRRLREN